MGHVSTRICASVSVFIKRSDIPTDTSASPFSFAFAVPTGSSFNTTSTVESGGALRTITVCAVAAPHTQLDSARLQSQQPPGCHHARLVEWQICRGVRVVSGKDSSRISFRTPPVRNGRPRRFYCNRVPRSDRAPASKDARDPTSNSKVSASRVITLNAKPTLSASSICARVTPSASSARTSSAVTDSCSRVTLRRNASVARSGFADRCVVEIRQHRLHRTSPRIFDATAPWAFGSKLAGVGFRDERRHQLPVGHRPR